MTTPPRTTDEALEVPTIRELRQLLMKAWRRRYGRRALVPDHEHDEGPKRRARVWCALLADDDTIPAHVRRWAELRAFHVPTDLSVGEKERL